LIGPAPPPLGPHVFISLSPTTVVFSPQRDKIALFCFSLHQKRDGFPAILEPLDATIAMKSLQNVPPFVSSNLSLELIY